MSLSSTNHVGTDGLTVTDQWDTEPWSELPKACDCHKTCIDSTAPLSEFPWRCHTTNPPQNGNSLHPIMPHGQQSTHAEASTLQTKESHILQSWQCMRSAEAPLLRKPRPALPGLLLLHRPILCRTNFLPSFHNTPA